MTTARRQGGEHDLSEEERCKDLPAQMHPEADWLAAKAQVPCPMHDGVGHSLFGQHSDGRIDEECAPGHAREAVDTAHEPPPHDG